IMANDAPLLEARGVSKYFGHVVALEDISMDVRAGQVTCLLGDNGAGKSTLIKIFSGVHLPTKGAMALDGEEVHFDVKKADRITREELDKIGISLRDTTQPVSTLSGGERQSVAIARAVYFGAKILILDEPTSALGVKQSAMVLRYINRTRQQGIGVVFITHNVHHAYLIGDRYTVLSHGHSLGSYEKGEVSMAELEKLMAGGKELEKLEDELQGSDATNGASNEAARSEGSTSEPIG